MKRVKAGCIFQTLVFSQREELNLTKEQAVKMNTDELSRYKNGMDNKGTRYKVTEEKIFDDGSIQVKIRKEYNDKTEVEEYFNL